MKAAYFKQYGGPNVLEIGDLPDPQPKDSEVLVKINYSSLNHLDIWVRRGMPSLKISFPHILGSDASGTVVKVGRSVKRVKEGDEVIVHPGIAFTPWEEVESLARDYRILGEHLPGTNAELISVPDANIFHKPKNLSWEDAAAVPLAYTTAWQMAVGRAQTKPGDKVLVHAAGSGVSSAAIQILKVLGAEVVATAGSEKKLKAAKALGADHTVNYNEAHVPHEIRRLYGKRGVDTILDHVGASIWDTHFECVKWGGKIVTCGATSGSKVSLDLRHVFYRQIQILGSTMGNKGDFPRILGLLESGQLRAVVDRSFKLEQIQDAHKYLENREQFGKVLLKVS